MQAAELQSPGAMAEDIGGLWEGWDELGFGALYQDNEGVSWQPAVQSVMAADLIPVPSSRQPDVSQRYPHYPHRGSSDSISQINC